MSKTTPNINKILAKEIACDHRGSSMGRSPWLPEEFSPDRVYVQHVSLNQGGYDRGGAYWGHGQRLHCVFTLGEEMPPVRLYYRADNRDDCIKQARREFAYYLMI